MRTGLEGLLRTERRGLVIGAGCFLVALLVRLIGIGWGLPTEERLFSYHPDEFVNWAYSEQLDPLSGDFDPGFYNYGTLYLTALSFATDVFGADSMPLIGRLISALAGAGTAWVVALLLVDRTHWIGAIMGGLAVAFAPGHVVHSRFQTVDVVAALFLTLCALYAARLAESEGPAVTWAVWAGVFAGLSATVKYTGALGLVAVLAAVLVSKAPDRWRAFGLSVLAALVVFIVGTPGALLNSSAFIRDFTYELAHSGSGHGFVFTATPNAFVYHVYNLVVGFGPLLLLIGLVGLGRAAWKRNEWTVPVIAMLLILYLAIGRADVKFFRYVLPLIPLLAVGFGWIMGRAHVHTNPRWKGLVALGIFALAGIGGGGLVESARWTSYMIGPDPRTQAARFIKRERADSVVGLVSDPWFYTPPLYPAANMPPMFGLEARFTSMFEASEPRVALYLPQDPAKRHAWDVRLLTEIQPEFVVFSSFESDDMERISQASGAPENARLAAKRYQAFLKALTRDYEIAQYYGQHGPTIHDLMYIRPRVWVWRRMTDEPDAG